ncbi:hypothetical protein Tco_0313526 [Tanacetum coccineum]
MNLSQQTIAYCLIFGLEINIGEIIFNDLIYKIQNRKKNRETNICYTRFISLVLEQILGDNYHDESLTVLKPHHISAASFQTPSASEVSLTSHMLKVAKLSKEPEESLILPSEEVNAEATADKSQSRTNVLLNQAEHFKLPLKNHPSLHAEAVCGPPLINPRLDASERQGARNQLIPLMPKRAPYDMSRVKFIKVLQSFPPSLDSFTYIYSSELSSMPDDDLHSVLAFDTIKSGDDDDMAYSRHMSKEGTTDTLFNAFAKYHSLSAESIPSSKLLVENQGEQPAEVARTNEGKELVVHKPEEKKLKGAILVEDDSDEDDLDKQPLSKRFKIETPFPNIENPIPLSSFIPEHLLNPEEKSLQDFTDQLTKEDVHQATLEGSCLKIGLDMRQGQDDQKLKTLGFSEWMEVYALASKKTGKSNDMLLQSLRAKFQWVINQAKKVDGMDRNLIPPPRVVPIQSLVINEPESGIFFMNRNTNIGFQRENEFHLAPTTGLIRIQNQIKTDSEISADCSHMMIYVIEDRK